MMLFSAFRLLPLVAVVLVACWLGLRTPAERFARLQALPESRFAPLVAALMTMAVILYEWGSLRQIPIVHDEASYLLQAETFARGRWAMPSPPIPSFFEQFHVFVTPTFASKYPPGHGLLLVPGIWLGLPGLMPLLLNGIAGALLFMLVRRVATPWIATLTFVLWLPLRTNLWFRPSYFSETTSSVLWLFGWWALLEWRATNRVKWLTIVAVCVGWMAITRPLTAVAFALPIAAVVLWRVARRRSWRSLAVPALVGIGIVGVMPIWSAKTTGNWRDNPYALYSKIYFPFDVLGFGLDTTPPTRTLPPDMQNFIKALGTTHKTHTVARLPRTLYDRWYVMYSDAFHGLRLAFVLFAIASLFTLTSEAWFAIGSSLLLTLCYLAYAHPANWNLYYLEITPLFPFLSACGIWTVWLALGRRGEAARRSMLRTTTPHAAISAAILVVVLLVPARAEVVRVHREQYQRRSYHAAFANAVAHLPSARTIVFIRYDARHDLNKSLIANQADLGHARNWFVYDRGAEDAKLIAMAPDRVPYVFDEANLTLAPLSIDKGTASSSTPPSCAGDDTTGGRGRRRPCLAQASPRDP
jgi:hypothetical protein